jgi:predicted DNA-binding transcriptional regulator YafY
MDASVGRLLTLLELLQAYRRLSANEIAARLEVDTRTVRRYVAGLQEMGIPVEGERGPAGGYRLRPGFKLPPLMFTNDEALAVVLGLLAVQRLGLLTDANALQGAVAKLDRVLPEGLRERVQAMQEVVELGLPQTSRGAAASASLVLQLTSSVREGLTVRIRYRSAAGAETERAVDPYGVVFLSGAWYMTGLDHLRGELRSFRLDRVLSCETTRDTFTRPAAFDAVSHLQRSIALMPAQWPVEVRLKTDLETARRRVPPTIATVEQSGDAVLLRSWADDLDWMARFLVEIGCDFEILEPEDLRKTVRALGRRLALA